MTTINRSFRWTVQPPSIAKEKLVGELNDALRGLGHDLDIAQSLLTLRKRAAPATLTGISQLYVDTADGSLKIRFGTSGTTKTVATDP